MSYSLANIRAALTSNIKSAIADVNMTGYLMTPVEPPCFEIDFPPDSLIFDSAFHRGGDELDLIVRGIVSMGDPDAGPALLDKWLDGTNSVKTAIQSDRTLGGAVEDLRVTQATGHRRVPIDNTVYLCAEWTVHLQLVP